MTSGIYCIENLTNEKKYIGQSISLEKRKLNHFSLLKRNKHYNIHLQNTYNKYGKDNFKFKILIYCEPFELTRYEQFFVDYYGNENLYNLCLECVDNCSGLIQSTKTIEKRVEKTKGSKHWNFGNHLSKEEKEKISSSLKGNIPWNKGKNKIYTEETRLKMGFWKGKRKSKETIEKIIKSNKGKHSLPTKKLWENDDYRKHMSDAHKGKPWSKARRDAYNRSKI